MHRTLLLVVALASPVLAQGTPRPKIIAWNDLGMHCMDADYSVFSILPPFNNLHAQVIDAAGRLVVTDSALRVSYTAVADPGGSINRTSVGKTNFWRYAPWLYGGSATPDRGLAGYDMPGFGNVPQPMSFTPSAALFHAEGVPITPYDDGGHKRYYPLMKVVAKDLAGVELASTAVVLPVSDEMECSLCHASGSVAQALPRAGWAFDPDRDRDYRRNILRLHDDQHGAHPLHAAALAAAGYHPAGLAATVEVNAQPILCARCHASNALPGTGYAGISALTAAVHAGHANVVDPITNQRLEDARNRASCYRCHPGSETRCLRGAMGGAVAADGALAMQCQDCHGSMSAVGASARAGWLDQPVCQNCHTGTATHNNGEIRYTSVFDAVTGRRRVAVDATFATNPDTPPGFSLYRLSKGHGNLRCEACHGSTHAEYPAGHGNDNLQSIALQGHEGTVAECTACHASMPDTTNGGPHGMHTIGTRWIDEHHDAVEHGGLAQCRSCHGSDDRGTVLSAAHGDRAFATRYGSKVFPRGAMVSCYACHDGPRTSDPNRNRAPVAFPAAAVAIDAAVAIPLSATDPDNDPLHLRIVKQPAHGRVALAGTVATYYPEPGFAGADTFTFLARDAAIDSGLGVVTVQRGASVAAYGTGYPGSAGVVPALAASARPVLGSAIALLLQNTAGVDTAGLLLASTERANVPTAFGGALLTEPVVVVAHVLARTGAQIPLVLPNAAALVGLRLHAQSLQADAGARFAVAFSRGLSLDLGR